VKNINRKLSISYTLLVGGEQTSPQRQLSEDHRPIVSPRKFYPHNFDSSSRVGPSHRIFVYHHRASYIIHTRIFKRYLHRWNLRTWIIHYNIMYHSRQFNHITRACLTKSLPLREMQIVWIRFSPIEILPGTIYVYLIE